MGIFSINLLHAAIIMLGPMTFGAIIIYPSPAGTAIRLKHGLADTSFEWSFYNSVTCLLAIAGPFITKLLLMLFKGSRKKTIFVLDILATVFWLVLLTTQVNIYAGIVVRGILGAIMGAYSSIGPMYLVEIAPSGASGFFGTLNQIGIVIGQVFFDFLGPSLDYKELCYVGAALPFLQSILIWFAMESPVVIKSNNDDKEKQKDNSEDDGNKESLWQKKYIKGLAIGVTLMFLQQFTGINGLLTNLADIMTTAGLNLDGNYQAGIATLSQLVAVFIGGLLMDKLGRKTVWVLSSGISSVALLIFALNEKYMWSNILPLISIFLYQLGFGLGLGPIPWFLVPEYFSDAVRPAATMFCTISNWIFAFIIVFSWPEMKETMKMFGAIIFFLVICVGSIVFGLIFVHEPEKVEPDLEENNLSDNSDSEKPNAL